MSRVQRRILNHISENSENDINKYQEWILMIILSNIYIYTICCHCNDRREIRWSWASLAESRAKVNLKIVASHSLAKGNSSGALHIQRRIQNGGLL